MTLCHGCAGDRRGVERKGKNRPPSETGVVCPTGDEGRESRPSERSVSGIKPVNVGLVPDPTPRKMREVLDSLTVHFLPTVPDSPVVPHCGLSRSSGAYLRTSLFGSKKDLGTDTVSVGTSERE